VQCFHLLTDSDAVWIQTQNYSQQSDHFCGTTPLTTLVATGLGHEELSTDRLLYYLPPDQ
jgi:hypothetical protein